MTDVNPNMADQVADLFREPYWIAAPVRQATGQQLAGLHGRVRRPAGDYASVAKVSLVIYPICTAARSAADRQSRRILPDGRSSLRLWVNQVAAIAGDPIDSGRPEFRCRSPPAPRASRQICAP